MPFRIVGSVHGKPVLFSLREGVQRVGSAAEVELRLGDPTISRLHAELRVTSDEIEIVDLDSRNGTFVAGRRLSREVLRVEVGSPRPIAFGRLELTLEALAQDDVETGVVIVPAAAVSPQRPNVPRANSETTTGTRALDVFTCEELPRLLAQLSAGADATTMAQAIGAALVRSLPLLGLDITTPKTERGEEGVLFTNRPPRKVGEDPAPHGVEIQCGGGCGRWVRATFPSASSAQVFRPLVESAALLVHLGLERAERAERAEPPLPSRQRSKSEPMSPPALPEPATLDAEVERIYRDAASVARGDVGVSIRGESGTGKEILARYLHAASPRAQAPFVALNCAALPRDLLEAELFGIERGVATGVEARAGKFELADGGTLFLDEIGDMALETQARILRVLQAGEVHRLGGSAARPARVRVVAATHRDLGAMRRAGEFREDLYYRIATWEVELPPLRKRRVDIPNLAVHFLARAAARRGVRPRGISRAALDRLIAYDWPGNIRQLENEMARAVLFLSDDELLGSARLSPDVLAGPTRRDGEDLAATLERVERYEIQKALAANGNDVARAAVALGLGRSTLYRRLRALGFEDVS